MFLDFWCWQFFARKWRHKTDSKTENNFQLKPWQVIAILKEYSEKNGNVKNVFENLIWLRTYDILKITKFLKIVEKMAENTKFTAQ